MDETNRLPSPEELKPLLRKLWPNRTHESNWLKDAGCGIGLHRWYQMTLNDAESRLRIDCTFCRSCTEVRVNTVRRFPD